MSDQSDPLVARGSGLGSGVAAGCRWLPLAAAAAEAFVLIPLCRSRRCEAREVRREAPDTQAGIPK